MWKGVVKMYTIDIRDNAAYFKDILRLIKLFSATPKFNVINSITHIKMIDANDIIMIDAVLQNKKQNNFAKYFGGTKVTETPVNLEVTFDVEELIKSITNPTAYIQYTEGAPTIITTGGTTGTAKVYPTFKTDPPTPNMHPTYMAQVNLATLHEQLKKMEFLVRMKTENNTLSLEHNNGDDTVTTKSLQVSCVNPSSNTNALYSCTYLKSLVKSLVPLADIALLKFAHDEPLAFEVTLKNGFGKITVYQAHAVEDKN